MRLLYISRLFSGLADTVRDLRWQPRGVPTVYRLLEGLDQTGHDIRVVFTVKDDAVGWTERSTTSFNIDGFGREITVVPQPGALPAGIGRARGYLREIAQQREIRRLFAETSPDLVYCDRVNVYQAALLARRTSVPVVWRVMGVPPAMHTMLEARGPVPAITRWAYRSPFAMVICSRDGSGGEPWMERALAPETPRRMMINGVDLDDDQPLPRNLEERFAEPATKILFVSRLVEDKGCLEFIDAINQAMNSAPGRFLAFIAGDGPYRSQMEEKACAAGHGDRFHFLGQLPHDQILCLQRHCDVYVSLNRMCNLTNANLEAMRTGVCMIIPSSPGIRGIDVDTDSLMPPNTIWRIANAGDVAGLRDALIELDANPEERERRARDTAARAGTFIPSWDSRIGEEIALLEQLAAAEN